MTFEQRDKNIARSILAIAGGILVYWFYRLTIWLIHWLSSGGLKPAGADGNFGGFCLENLSIILVVYVIICLQIAGIVEFRQRKSFTEAFFLGIILTPVFMLIYMKFKKADFSAKIKEV